MTGMLRIPQMMTEKEAEKRSRPLARSIMLYQNGDQHCLMNQIPEEDEIEDIDLPNDKIFEDKSLLSRRDTFRLSPKSASEKGMFVGWSLPMYPMDSSTLSREDEKGDSSIELTYHDLKKTDEGIRRINSCYAFRSLCQDNQVTREIPIPDLLKYDYHVLKEYDSSGEDMTHYEELSGVLSHISGEKMVSIEPQILPQSFKPTHPRLKIGLILSGGPAPGGHNVIAGAFDYLMLRNPQSQLIGFIGGIGGFLNRKYEVITSEKMGQFRNLGGFNMLWSGRGKIGSDADLERAVDCIRDLDLDGLIVVGGDGSNSNAAILANHLEYVYNSPECGSKNRLYRRCCVVGVPKTVDGDVRSHNIEITFGFDTATRTYSELIGNLCTDASSTQYTYHFIRVMGRSASHLALECGMQTHPNILLIGEEVKRKQHSLSDIVDYIVDVMEMRFKMGMTYGVILIPEGLIEFIPEIQVLIEELSEITESVGHKITTLDPSLLKKSRGTWGFLPEYIRDQLLMERESNGHIVLSKIATERLLLILVENRIAERKLDHLTSLAFLSHYFGYEGRCAIPSGFDASYCYALGYNAGILISSGRNGYMSVIRNLKMPIEDWIPLGLPFLHIMEMRTTGTVRYPAIRKNLLDLDGDLFKLFQQVRDIWTYHDLYRSPGPIQIHRTDDMRCFTISLPSIDDLLPKSVGHSVGNAVPPVVRRKRFLLEKSFDCLSELQKERLKHRPVIPHLCYDLKSRMKKFKRVLNSDQYVHSQIVQNYPYMTKMCGFSLYEVFLDHSETSANCGVGTQQDNVKGFDGLRVGILALSKHAPGVLNVIWGLYERLSLVGGVCIAFNGAKGLLNMDYIELVDGDLDLFKNQGGMDMVRRSRRSHFYDPQNWDLALKNCTNLRLNGLVILGDECAMTQASLLTEYFLSKKSKISIVGVPVAGSNGFGGRLIESCVGFDSNARLYSSLVGNVLTDAVSMPKYWHFVKILGRYPSLEVLECALQTHPNFVIIAEEYGSDDKTLFDVVHDIADVVCKRAFIGKNFGTVLIPDHLVLHLPNTKSMLSEICRIILEATSLGKRKEAIEQLERYGNNNEGCNGEWVQKMTPWSLAVFSSLPSYIREELLRMDTSEFALERLDIEIMLAKMVKEELNVRKSRGEYRGNYSAVTHYFGYQGQCCIPSEFDCSLAFTYGHVAAIAVENGLTGYCCSIRGLCGPVQDWKLFAIPFNCLMKIVPGSSDISPMMKDGKRKESLVIPSSTVSLNGKAFMKFRLARKKWLVDDLFTNPGPTQFDGTIATNSMVLITENAEYYHMLRSVESFTSILKNTCKFGVSEEFLHHVFVQLWGLLKVTQSPEDLLELVKSIRTADGSSNTNLIFQ